MVPKAEELRERKKGRLRTTNVSLREGRGETIKSRRRVSGNFETLK
jgi:hypothetical protein